MNLRLLPGQNLTQQASGPEDKNGYQHDEGDDIFKLAGAGNS
jgi:hypothetical protein